MFNNPSTNETFSEFSESFSEKNSFILQPKKTKNSQVSFDELLNIVYLLETHKFEGTASKARLFIIYQMLDFTKFASTQPKQIFLNKK